jgi:ATP-dependent helicase/nuclease subunit B
VAASLAAGPPDTDTLFQARASGWAVLRCGGADGLAEAVQAHQLSLGTPGLLLDLDAGPGDEFQAAAQGPAPALTRCADAEDEARAATAQVLAALRAGGTVALVAQDRETVRRVHALLARVQVPVVDDTGWRVATTRAGAQAMAVLRAARSLGNTAGAEDARLDWLKDDALGRAQPQALVALEAWWRGRPVGAEAEGQAKALWAAAQARLTPLVAERTRPLAEWLQCLATLWLGDPAEAQRWQGDAAGRAVLLALRLDASAGASPAWQAVAGSTRFTLDEFTAWVDEALEDASVAPDNPPEARVVITPLARVMLRPFAAVVCPGADERRLGVAEPRPDLLGPALAAALGLPGPQERLRRETLAFTHMLRLPGVCLLHRAAEGAESLGPSPLVQCLVLARAQAGVQPAALTGTPARLPVKAVPAQPVQPPAPQAGPHWPPSLSASAVEALRTCPYRFYSRVLLGLSEADELDQAADKRDHGN